MRHSRRSLFAAIVAASVARARSLLVARPGPARDDLRRRAIDHRRRRRDRGLAPSSSPTTGSSAVGRRGELPPPPGATRVDLSGKTVMPALVDDHVHMGYRKGTSFSADNYTRENLTDMLDRYAFYGIAAILETGTGRGDLPYQVRADAHSSRAISPPAAASACPMPAPAAPMRDSAYGVTTEEEARRDVRELAAHKPDMVKIWVDDRNGTVEKLNPDLYRAIIDEAHKHNLRVMAHVFALDDVKDLVRVRHRRLRPHGARQGRRRRAHRLAQATPRRVLRRDAVGRAARALHRQAGLGRRSGAAPGLFGRGHRAARRTALARPEGRSEGGRRAAARSVRPTCATPRSSMPPACGSASAPTPAASPAASSSASAPMSSSSCLVTKAGLTPMQAIVLGTHTAAEILGLDDLGMIGPGKSADFIVLDANPLDNIANTRQDRPGLSARRGSAARRAVGQVESRAAGEVMATGHAFASRNRRAVN